MGSTRLVKTQMRVVGRRLGGGGHHHHGPGFHPPHVSRTHKMLAGVFGGVAWFWLMYRFSQDGAVMFGLKDAPWVADVKKEEADAKKEAARQSGAGQAGHHH
jgi:hypothetical protein